MDKSIEFKRGHLFYSDRLGQLRLSLYSSFDMFREMGKYYKAKCVVKHWVQRTLESGGWVESEMLVSDAIYSMKEHHIEKGEIIELI